MKKSVLATVIIVLFTIPAVYAQIDRVTAMTLAKGNTFQHRIEGGGVFLVGNFEGKINRKPIEFEYKGRGTTIINNGSLSNDELRLVENGLDLITSALNRGKFEMPEMNFKLKAEGKALLATVESRRAGAVFEGKFEWTINGKSLEFKQDAAGSIIVNNGKLTDNEIWVLDLWINHAKSNFGLVRSKPVEQR